MSAAYAYDRQHAAVNSMHRDRFEFDSFDEEEKPPEPMVRLVDHEQIVAEVQTQAYETGVQAAFDAGAEAATKIGHQLAETLVGVIEREVERAAMFAAALPPAALALTRALYPTIAAQHGFAEIETMLASAVAEAAREPRLIIRVADQHLESVQTVLKELTENQAYGGKIVLLADATLGPADIRVEWAEGGLERLTETILNRLAEQLERIPRPQALSSDKANASSSSST